MNQPRDERRWRKSSHCDDPGCVEIAVDATAGAPVVLVRNSTVPGGRILSLPPARWRDFLAGVHTGELDDLT